MKKLLFKRMAHSSSATLESKWHWLPPGFHNLYQFVVISQESLATTLASLVAELIIAPLLSSQYLTNLKGAGSNDYLLKIEATLAIQQESLPLIYEIRSSFFDFPSRDSIRSSWANYCNLAEFQEMTLQELLALDNIKIHTVSLALDIFAATMLTKISTFGPVVREMLRFDWHSNKYTLLIDAEGLKDEFQLPLSYEDIFHKLDLIIKNQSSLSIVNEYQKLTASLSF